MGLGPDVQNYMYSPGSTRLADNIYDDRIDSDERIHKSRKKKNCRAYCIVFAARAEP